jgi:hypothetical protein
VAAATLAAMDLETNLVVVLPWAHDRRDRTYSAALSVRAWLKSTQQCGP